MTSSDTVVKGFKQVMGENFNDTYASTAKLKSVRLLCALAAQHNLRLTQYAVPTAFLNGDITEEIYVVQHTGFVDGSGRVCKLKKALD